MNVDDLRVGKHVSTGEMRAVRKVVAEIRVGGDRQIEVIGDRVEGNRVNTKVLEEAMAEASIEEKRIWQTLLNDQIRTRDLSASRTRELRERLPINTPRGIAKIFEQSGGDNLGSELKLRIDGCLPEGVRCQYPVDTNGELNIEVFDERRMQGMIGEYELTDK